MAVWCAWQKLRRLWLCVHVQRALNVPVQVFSVARPESEQGKEVQEEKHVQDQPCLAYSSVHAEA